MGRVKLNTAIIELSTSIQRSMVDKCDDVQTTRAALLGDFVEELRAAILAVLTVSIVGKQGPQDVRDVPSLRGARTWLASRTVLAAFVGPLAGQAESEGRSHWTREVIRLIVNEIGIVAADDLEV